MENLSFLKPCVDKMLNILKYSSIATVTGYGIDYQDSIPDTGRDSSLCHHTQTSFRTHPASYTMHSGSSFLECKAGGCKTDHLPPLTLCPMMLKHRSDSYPYPSTKKWDYTHVPVMSALVAETSLSVNY